MHQSNICPGGASVELLRGYRHRMRDGVPLPGLSPPDVVSQLAHRVLGPLLADRVRLVLDYHGLTGQPAGTLRGIATRHGVSTVTVSTHVRAVRAAGARLPIPPAVITAATRRSAPSDDHLSRVRIARTLGLPVPSPWRPAPMPRDDAVPSSALRVARVAARVLAAVGPLEDDTLLAAVTRSRRFRHRTPLTATSLAAALSALGAVRGPDGRWSAPPGLITPDRYQVIVTGAAGRELTRTQMIEVLITAGYSRSSATGRMSSSHPLFTRVAPDRYRVISRSRPEGAGDPVAPSPGGRVLRKAEPPVSRW